MEEEGSRGCFPFSFSRLGFASAFLKVVSRHSYGPLIRMIYKWFNACAKMETAML